MKAPTTKTREAKVRQVLKQNKKKKYKNWKKVRPSNQSHTSNLAVRLPNKWTINKTSFFYDRTLRKIVCFHPLANNWFLFLFKSFFNLQFVACCCRLNRRWIMTVRVECSRCTQHMRWLHQFVLFHGLNVFVFRLNFFKTLRHIPKTCYNIFRGKKKLKQPPDGE